MWRIWGWNRNLELSLFQQFILPSIKPFKVENGSKKITFSVAMLLLSDRGLYFGQSTCFIPYTSHFLHAFSTFHFWSITLISIEIYWFLEFQKWNVIRKMQACMWQLSFTLQFLHISLCEFANCVLSVLKFVLFIKSLCWFLK